MKCSNEYSKEVDIELFLEKRNENFQQGINCIRHAIENDYKGNVLEDMDQCLESFDKMKAINYENLIKRIDVYLKK